MSDFDEEAEREKLREKYGDDEDREATEQMSELLLKGATMTNAHCSECGSPIFRYDGQEFCPTCQKPVDRGDAGENGAAGEGNVEVTAPEDDAHVQFGGQGDVDQGAEAPDAGSPDETDAEPPDQRHVESGAHDQEAPPTRQAPSVDPSRSTRVPETASSEAHSGAPTADASSTDASSTDASSTDAPTTEGPPTDAARGDVASNVARARASLARTAARFARVAEATDDPAVAREHLQAAREAADALDELD